MIKVQLIGSRGDVIRLGNAVYALLQKTNDSLVSVEVRRRKEKRTVATIGSVGTHAELHRYASRYVLKCVGSYTTRSTDVMMAPAVLYLPLASVLTVV